MGTIPSKQDVAELRDRDNLTFDAIAQKFGVSRQAAWKSYKKFCQEYGLEWRTRRVTNSAVAISADAQ